MSSNSSSFCVITNDLLGTVNCSPTTEDLLGVNVTGHHDIKFKSDDQDSAIIYTTIQFNITPVNDAPEFSPGLIDQSINENEKFNYAISGIDEESNWPLTFNLNVTDNLELIINSTSNTTATIMFKDDREANYFEDGNYSIDITIYDSLNANTTERFNLTIVQINQNPELKYIPSQNGTQGDLFSFKVYANDTDSPDVLNFTVSSLGCPIDNPWSIETTNNTYTNATGLINITNLTNDHIVCRNVRITVDDGQGEEDSQEVFLNLTNTNDAPSIYNLSYSPGNSGGNDITNLTAYAESIFKYQVNASDIDSLTYMSEELNYTDNSSLFDINNNGLIEVNFNQTQLGNYSFLINVTDDEGLQDSTIMYLTILNNSAPVLNFIGNLSCIEDMNCFKIINATDNEGDNLSFITNNTEKLSFTNNISQNPVISAYLSYTYNQSFVGSHQIIVDVIDSRGAKDNETIWLIINNSNDAPKIEDFEFNKGDVIVETHLVDFNIYADDEDYGLPENYKNITVDGINVSEYVHFNVTNITGAKLFNISTLFNTTSNRSYGRITFTPGINDFGNYSVNITVTDYEGIVDSIFKNFTVLNRQDPPLIVQIMPHGSPYINYTNFSWINTNVYDSNLTSINFTENRTVLYNINVTDDTCAQENLSYTWKIDGVFKSNSSYLNMDYGLFDQGEHNITVMVEDDTYESAEWEWNVVVENINRAPILINDLTDLNGDDEITKAEEFDNYLKKYPDTKFIDPDDDLNGDNEINNNETSKLTYDVIGGCSVATVTINNHSISISPLNIGVCNVTFRANDPDEDINVESNSVLINVTDIDDEKTIVYITTTRTNTKKIEVEVKEEVPKAIEVIIPDIIISETEKEVEIPIILRNNWNKNINGIYLSGSANVSFLDVEFSQDSFEYIPVGEDVMLTALVNGEFGEGDYEVIIGANVSSPRTSDYAVVLIKSGEDGLGDKDLRQNIIFAQDLLSSNPECLELNEILELAQKQIENGSTSEGLNTINGVIDGCQYLMTLSEKEKEEPEKIMANYINENLMKYLKIFVGLILLSILAVIIMRKVHSHQIKKLDLELQNLKSK